MCSLHCMLYLFHVTLFFTGGLLNGLLDGSTGRLWVFVGFIFIENLMALVVIALDKMRPENDGQVISDVTLWTHCAAFGLIGTFLGLLYSDTNWTKNFSCVFVAYRACLELDCMFFVGLLYSDGLIHSLKLLAIQCK